jgi:ubiquinone/menaquinone biosynthesis C-methylase UbiE
VSEIIDAFNDVAPFYEEWYEEPMGAQVLEAELRGLEEFLPDSGLGVEVGAGTGVFAKRLSTHMREIVCVDPSPEMLMRAAEKDLHTVLCVGEDMPFRIGSFDFTYLVAVLEFLSDPMEVLGSIKEAMKTETPLVTLTINRSSPWGSYYTMLAENGDPVFSHACLYDMDEVREFLRRSGFIVVDALSTLSDPPSAKDVGVGLVTADPEAGVVLIKSLK